MAFVKSAVGWSFFAIFAIVVSEGLAFGTGTYYYFKNSLPNPSPEAMMAMPEATRIYDRNGELLYEVHGDVKRRFVPLKDIPDYFKKATIAIEDKNFYEHRGYDLIAMTRAFYKNYKNKGISQGASTITQQLARTMFLDQEQAYTRKIREIILAIEIEKRYNKDQILEMYLNNIPYGSIAYGVSAAAEIYLNKSVNKLSLIESAYLAALPKAPSDYSPFGENKRALDERALQVIVAMRMSGYLSIEEVSQAFTEPKPQFVSPPHLIRAPHFVFYALEELGKMYGQDAVRDGGFNVYTTLDYKMQKEAEAIVEKWGKENEKKYGAGNAALTAVDPGNGEILVMVGSRNYFEPKYGTFNVATSPRQPGSSFKPYVYATAFANGLTPDTIIVDSQTNFASANYGVSYIPRNYSGRHYGAVTVRKALAGSLNVPAVKTIVQVGVDKAIDTAEGMGISTLGDRKRFGPALALGGGEVKLLDHTAAMGVFGNAGKKQEVSSIRKINKRNGDLVYERVVEKGKQVIDERSAYWISDILSDNKAREYIFGRSGKLSIPGHRVAVKTGTTQDFHDAWTVGFTPSIAVGVWSGNNDNKPMKQGADGSFVAAPIWKEFMTLALGKVAKKDFTEPKSIKKVADKSGNEKVKETIEKNDTKDLSKKDFQSVILKKENPIDLIVEQKEVAPLADSQKQKLNLKVTSKEQTIDHVESDGFKIKISPSYDFKLNNSTLGSEKLLPSFMVTAPCQNLVTTLGNIGIISQSDGSCQMRGLPLE